ncbi:hypothetical protein C0995_015437 [Termitomyces sp. Mi166|nr:hypothetical protein C0995_015437 [Termitomyces sp. Mi166\
MVSQSTTFQALRDNAAYHARLISAISELDYVPSALKHQTSYVDDLQTRLKQSEAQLKKLSEMTNKERKEHEYLRDSTARRLAHKLTGRKDQFQAMVTKEEREYVEALEKELAERDTYNLLVSMAEEAKREKADLAEKVVRYEALKKELADLYMQVFDEYPEDDRLEYQVQSTQALHDQIQDTLNAECRVCEILAHADRTMNACEAQVKEALTHSQRAQALAKQTESLCKQARNVSPFVESIGPLKIAQGVEWDAAQRRADNAGNQLIEVAQTLETERLVLASYRKEVFQRISREEEHSTLSDQPPGYSTASAQSEASAASGAPLAQEPVEFSRSMTASPQPMSSTISSPPPRWGSRNPYAATLAIRSRPPSYDQS